MGEYATYAGSSVKIGTCENLYYLRYDQRNLVSPEPNNLNLRDCLEVVRFRFPWPSEDGIPPGGFDGAWKAVAVPGYEVPTGLEHGTLQFTAPGYVASLPCPESDEWSEAPYGGLERDGIRAGRNGFAGKALLIAQKVVPDVGLVPVLRCGGCGAMWREEDPEEIGRIAHAFEAEGDTRERRDGSGDWWWKVGMRLRAGVATEAT